MGENTCKWCDQQWFNFRNIQIAHTTNSRTKNKHYQKIGRRHFMKGHSTLLIITEMHIKITARYHFLSARMVIIKKSTNNKCWRGCGEKGTLLHHRWEGVGAATVEQYEGCLKTKYTHTHTHSHKKEWANSIWGKRKDISHHLMWNLKYDINLFTKHSGKKTHGYQRRKGLGEGIN